MKAKHSMIAYVKGTRITVDLSKKNVLPPVGATRFYLRYTDENGKRHEDALGSDFVYALAQVRTEEARKEYEEKTGHKFPGTQTEIEKQAERRPVRVKALGRPIPAAIHDWLEQKRITPGMAQSTIKIYGAGLAKFTDFAESRISNVEDITREDMFRFVTYLREEQGLSQRTASNYFRYMIIFLKGMGIRLNIPLRQWGEPAPRKAQVYTQEQLDAFFLAATTEESVLFKSFLFTGMRNKELANLTYADIDFKHSVWSVQPKENWRTKSRNSVRSIPVPPFHTKDIRERMLRHGRSESDLVFPDERGKVHNYYLVLLKRLAKRAGVTGRVDIHKFRSTCATMWLRDGVDVFEVARLLGHCDPNTLKQYIEMVNLESEETRERTAKLFARWDNISRS